MRTLPQSLTKLSGFLSMTPLFDDERYLQRLEDLHKSVPQVLPEKRFFKH